MQGDKRRGRVAGQSREALVRQAQKQRRHAAELKAWNASDQPEWLTEGVYCVKIQARLSGITVPALSSALGLSVPYAGENHAGRQLPHSREWFFEQRAGKRMVRFCAGANFTRNQNARTQMEDPAASRLLGCCSDGIFKLTKLNASARSQTAWKMSNPA